MFKLRRIKQRRMGKLLIGHFGHPPEAESVTITLKDCHQRLGMKPSDFVSSESPAFFTKAHGAIGKYLVFEADDADIRDGAVWKKGFYLLPLEAADALKAFDRKDASVRTADVRPFDVECKTDVPPDVLDRISKWAHQVQPMLFRCHCAQLRVKVDPPAVLRRHWKVRLTCDKRCQPALKMQL
jgi:hypothetical protein